MYSEQLIGSGMVSRGCIQTKGTFPVFTLFCEENYLRTSYKLILGSIGCAALIWGGIAMNHRMVCDELEEDYLNAFSSMNRVQALEGIAGENKRLGEVATVLKKAEDGKMQAATEALFIKCGDRATNTALRQAGESVGF